MSVLLKDGKPVARTKASLKPGWVRAAYHTVSEAIDANREKNLLNGFDVKVSNAKQWQSDEHADLPIAIAINGGDSEFHIMQRLTSGE